MIAIPAGSLKTALDELARQTGISIGFGGRLPALRTPQIEAPPTPGKAFRRLLAGTDFRAVQVDATSWRIERWRTNAVLQPAAAEPTREEQLDIVVTSGKREERLSDLPLSVSVVMFRVAGRPLSQQSLIAALATTDSVYSTNLGPGRNRIFLRGVADSAFNGPTQSTISLFLDDARISYASPDPDLRLVDVARIEVLRGPQGTLYGTGALGGVVRVVTRQPDLSRWSEHVAVEGSTVAHGTQGYAVEGTINAPLVTDVLALRVSAWSERMPGWIDDTGRKLVDVNRTVRFGGRGNLAWQIADDWRTTLSVTGQRLLSRDSQYATSGLTRATAIAEPEHNDFFAAVVNIRGVVGVLDLTSTTSFVSDEFNSQYDATGSAARLGLATPLAYEDRHSMLMRGQELRVSNTQARYPWVIGLSFLDARNRSLGRFIPGADVAVVRQDQLDETFEGAVYMERSQPLLAAFDLKLGLRAFIANTHNERAATSEPLNSDAGLTPSLTLSWHPTRGGLVWFRYGSAVRPGDLITSPVGTTARAHSDELKSIELGWRTTDRSGRISVHGAIFGYLWDHVQSDTLSADGRVTSSNVGSAANAGVEAGGRFQIAHLEADFGATLQRARLQESAAVPNTDRRLPVVPDVSAHLDMSSTLNVAAVTVKPFVNIQYLGSTRLSFDPALDRHTRGYLSAGAGVNIVSGMSQISITATNVFDRRSDTFAFGNPFTIVQTAQYTPLRPRTFAIRLDRDF